MTPSSPSPRSSRSPWPLRALSLAAAMAACTGWALGAIGWLLAAAVIVGLAVALAKGKEPMADTGARMVASAAPFAVVGPLMWAVIPAWDPSVCADLAPGLFLLLWPPSVVAMGMGVAVMRGVARREGIGTPDVPLAALWGLAGLGLAIHLVMASMWACGVGAGIGLVAWCAGIWTMLAVRAALDRVQEGRSR